MKVEIFIVLLSVINTVLLKDHDDMQKSGCVTVLGKKSNFFYRINNKIHTVTNKLFVYLKLSDNVRKNRNFQFLLKSHSCFNNMAQNYYEAYEKLLNPNTKHTCRAGDKKLDEIIQNIIQEKFEEIKSDLIYLLPQVINIFNKINDTEFNIPNNIFTDVSVKGNENVNDAIEKNKTASNYSMSNAEKITKDFKALKKMLMILERFDTGSEDIIDSNHKNNLTNTLENIVNREIETIRNNVTKLVDITQMHLKSLLDVMTPKKAIVTKISFDNTLLTLSENTMENFSEEIIYDIKAPNDTAHTFDNVTLSFDDFVIFPTNASMDEPIGTRRIYHGKKTRVKNYPFLASLHLASEFLCAGSIISDDLIITAASCLHMVYKKEVLRSNPHTIFARVGSDFPKRSGKLIPIVEVNFHPKYDPVTLKNNLAIVKVLKKLKHTKEIKIIKYDKETDALKMTVREIKIIGWGARNERDKTIGLQRPSVAHLDIYDINDCREIYSKYYVSETNFCAGFTSKGGGACTGDVGDPAVVSQKLVGVVSFGPSVCGMLDAPTVFTKLGYYADWIDDVIHKSRANQSKLYPITVNSTELPELLGIPEFTVTNTTKKELEPISNDKSPLVQGQSPVSIINVPTNEGQKSLPKKEHTLNQIQKSTILKEHLTNPGQKLLPQGNFQSIQGNKPQVISPLRQGQGPPSKKLQYGRGQNPLSYDIMSHLNPKQIPIAPEKFNMNLRFGKKLIPNLQSQIKRNKKTFTYKNPDSKQDLIPVFVNQRHHPQNLTENLLNNNNDELSIIHQIIQDIILGNETVMDYLSNNKVLDDVSEFVENVSGDRQLSDLEKSKLNENTDTASQIIMKQNIHNAKLHTTPSYNHISTNLPMQYAQTNALDDESYYDGKPTQIDKFIESLEIPKKDVSSYYEMEIPIETAPFTTSQPNLDKKNENYKYRNQYEDKIRVTDKTYGTKTNDAKHSIPDNNIYHKAMDKKYHVSFGNRQNNKNISHTILYKDFLNINHKGTDPDQEIDKIVDRNYRNQDRDLKGMTEKNETRERSMTKGKENRDSRSVTERNFYSDSRSWTDRLKSMNERNKKRYSISITQRNVNKDSRTTTQRKKNRDSKSMTERNENEDSRSMSERKEGKTSKNTQSATKAANKDSSQLEREINFDIGGVTEVISQEDFNYAYNDEKGIEMRSRKGGQYYNFDFMTDYNY